MLIPTAHPAAPRASPKHANAPPWPGTIWEQKSFVNSRIRNIHMCAYDTGEKFQRGDAASGRNRLEADT
jgi:hypothetical protein